MKIYTKAEVVEIVIKQNGCCYPIDIDCDECPFCEDDGVCNSIEMEKEKCLITRNQKKHKSNRREFICGKTKRRNNVYNKIR